MLRKKTYRIYNHKTIITSNKNSPYYHTNPFTSSNPTNIYNLNNIKIVASTSKTIMDMNKTKSIHYNNTEAGAYKTVTAVPCIYIGETCRNFQIKM